MGRKGLRSSRKEMDLFFGDRFETYTVEQISEQCPVERVLVPPDKVSWSIPWPEYNPPTHSDGCLDIMPWADPDISEKRFKPKWNEFDNGLDRRSYEKGKEIKYAVVDGLPINPKGRTGLRGRGSLCYWGPNHSAEVILTRWKKGGKKRRHAMNPVTKLPILECLVFLGPNADAQWHLPTCYVNYDGPPSRIFKSLFNGLIEDFNLDDDTRRAFNDFYHEQKEVYKGYVDDIRNTDNAWMESNSVNFHDVSGWNTYKMKLYNKDQKTCKWMDIHETEKVFPPHRFLLERVSKIHCLNANVFDSD
ncbi:ADP-ribose pyrophosphatase, mitochondrial [Trichonephila inaurata madagascariensis]|uniref:ADP-ribose pyrophosphatase, mitochondrial n=1 Tax=Trichonephila inaurata madagascariensis TaxID=2747483 RepID=A0A8X6IQ06_9ARAC|nr:ADP-ribose pyrophosphatase, mitochondrial [Trichonephila inaurata madagascariensis]